MSNFVHADIELAWAAGFFDGEGCFKGARTNGVSDKKYGRISISQKDPEVLYRFKAAVDNIGFVNGPYGNNKDRSQMWYYTVAGKRDILRVCNMLRPYLSNIKLKDMDSMIQNMENVREYSPRLSHDEVRKIRADYQSTGLTMQEIGEQYNRSAGAISDIVHRRTWAHVE